MTLRTKIVLGILVLFMGFINPIKGLILEAMTAINSYKDESWYGTAFAINNQGYMVTAYHVVGGARNLFFYVNNKRYDVTVIATDPSHDVAIVKSNYTSTGYISVTNDRLTNIKVYGYPDADIYGYDLHVSSGTATYGGVTEEYININAFICEGNSGSPVVNKNNSLEGIVTNGDTIKGPCSKAGFGPSVKYVIELANKYGIQVDYSIKPIIPNMRNFIVILWGTT